MWWSMQPVARLAAGAVLGLTFTPAAPGVGATLSGERPAALLVDTGRQATPDRGWTPTAPAGGVFKAPSQWRSDVRAAPAASDSQDLVDDLADQVASHWGGNAAFNVSQYAVAAYTVSSTTPRHDVAWDNCQHKDYIPSQLYSPLSGAAFVSVPIPRGAVTSPGTDGEMSLYDPGTDQLWELWKARHRADGWHACWGGRIDRASTSVGYFPDGTGVSASGLAAIGGAVRMSEVRSGRINHAMSLAVIHAAHWSDFSWPAQRSDGDLPLSTVGAIQEGRRFRLPASIDVRSLGLTRLGRIVARAAQRYGFIVMDRAGAVGLVGESGAPTVAAGGRDPWSRLLDGGPSYSALHGFPWDKLEALPLDYGQPS